MNNFIILELTPLLLLAPTPEKTLHLLFVEPIPENIVRKAQI